MKKYILISLCLLTAAGSFAQNKDFKFKFYGQIRTDRNRRRIILYVPQR